MIDALLSDLETLLLLALAGGALLGGASMLVLRQPMRVALALILTMICLGGIFGLLGMHFAAAFQVLIYVGAVMVFMVFAIMLLDERDPGALRYSRLLVPGVAGFLLLLAMLVGGVWRALPSPRGELSDGPLGIGKFATTFLSEYWLHFELTSVLLVAAVVAAMAAIRIGRRKDRHG
jgi:NADH-quinone oxidoreductase subunit J